RGARSGAQPRRGPGDGHQPAAHLRPHAGSGRGAGGRGWRAHGPALQRLPGGGLPADHQGLRHHHPRRHGQPRGRAGGELPGLHRGVALGDGDPVAVAEPHRLRGDDRDAPGPPPRPPRPGGLALTTRARVTLAAVGGAALLPVLLPHPFVLTIATQAVSWALLSGYTGQISFGHAGFFALGAYAAAASTKHADVSPWLGLLVGATIAAAVGLLTGFPALRLRGHYLALVTLGLAEIIRLVAQNWLDVTGGPFGIHDFRSLPGLPAGALVHRQAMYVVVVAIVVVSVAVMYQVCERTSAGQAFRAIREDEV